MYARGNNVYGQQPYAAQSVYGKNIGSAFPGSSLVGSDGASQLIGNSRHSAMLTGSQEADIGAYRAATSHYGGQYASVYGSTVLTAGQQAQSLGPKGTATSLENRGDYTRGDYMSSNIGYAHKAEQFADKAADYASNERIHYGREFQNESTMRYVNSTGFANQHKTLDQASLLRKDELLKQQALQSVSIDAGNRQGEYFSSRGPTLRHSAQDLVSNYGGRLEVDPRVSAYGAQQAQSILGAAPRRGVDDLVYPQGGANSGYGVSLPPGRDYAVGKGILGTSLEADAASRGGLVRIDEHKVDRVGYGVEMELREEERRREHLREREKEREREEREREARVREREFERERDREHERRREREREREREHDRERARERERMLDLRDRNRDLAHKLISDARHERSPLRTREYRASSLSKDVRMPRRDSPLHQSSHRRYSPDEEKRRDYVCKVYGSRLNETARDFLAVDRRFPRLFISPELSKVVVHWPKEDLKLSIRTPVSFEHDFIEERASSKKEIPVVDVANNNSEKLLHRDTVWNAKIILMSGLSKNSIDSLSSDKVLDGRIPHICNILRFSVLKNDHSLKAIGGSWDVCDGENPSVDGSSLIQTARRYLKQTAQLDLQDCTHWNRFLEIHYERAGDDGIFTHKEITVLFVPDLSECVPSIDSWKTQWLQHKKDVANREISAKNKKSTDRKSKDREVVKDDAKESKEGGSLKKKEAEGTKPVDSEKHSKGVKSETTKEKEKSKEGKDEKHDQSKSKEKQFGDPPKHPGFIIRTKGNKDSKLFSLSLSLDSLLDYSDKDVEESTFEVSLFAESLNEMLQYQMGCRLLSFLEKVRLKFSTKRKQRKKRQSEAIEKAKELPVKRLKASVTTEPEAVPSVAAGDDVKEKKDSPSTLVSELENGKSNKETDIDPAVKVGEGESDPQEEPGEEEEEEGSEEEELDNDNDDADPMEEDPEEDYAEEDGEEDEENEDVGEENEASEKVVEGTESSKLEKVKEEVLEEEKSSNTKSKKGKEESKSEKGKKKDSEGDEEKKKRDEAPIALDKEMLQVGEGTEGSKLEKVKDEIEEEEKSSSTTKSTKGKEESKSEKVKKKDSEGEKEKKKRDEAPIVALDKEVLQAFRFFDRNRVGYIRVEDMRAILHNLGMFLSHREVKELVQSALLESNTGRDDRILYTKLLKLML